VFDGLQCDVGYDWVISELYNTHTFFFTTWIWAEQHWKMGGITCH